MHSLQVALAGALLACLAAGSACAPSVAPKAVHRMGERVTAGSLVYDVFETQWKPQLGEPQGAPANGAAGPRIPKDRFFLIRLNVVNGGSSEVMVPTLTLLDDSGQTYTELSDGDQVPKWIGFLRRVKPAETLEGNVVFDVPPKHYRLQVSDETSQKTFDIDIPLSFTSESPEIPTPGQ